MAHLMRMPEITANAIEAVLTEWLVSDGAAYQDREPLASIETDKAVVDVEAESPGTLLRTLVAPGTTVAVGAPIALIAEPGEQVDDVDTLLADLGAVEAVRFEEAADSNAAIEVASQPPTTIAMAVSKPMTPGADGDTTAPRAVNDERVFASPIARKLAREAGLDYRSLTGTGPNGRVRRRDVEAALAQPAQPVAPVAMARPPAADQAATSPAKPPKPDLAYVDVEHSRLRRAVAARLTESKQNVPHFYVRGSALVDELIKLRATVNARVTSRVSFNDFVIKAAAIAHTRHHEMNAIWTNDAVRRFERVDIAVAVASERGLLTPVVRGVDALSLSAVAGTMQELVARANAGQLRQEELEGGALSVSNLGMYSTEEFTAIINPPQSAILAVGAIREEAVVVAHKVKPRQVLRFVLSVDHRPIDGAMAAQWMKTFIGLIEDPIQIMV